MNYPLVSVIIPTYNRKKSCERLIKSLLSSTYKNIEIIVVDDASLDNTDKYLNSKFNSKQIKVFRNKKNMFAAGSKNEGQKRAKGKYYAFIDDDNVVDKNMLEELVSVLEDNHEIGEVAPINYNFNKKDAILLTRSTRNMWTTKTQHLRTLDLFKDMKIWEGDDAPNAFMIRSDIVNKHSITFDKSYGIMYEESDYAYRIKNQGYKMFMVRSAIIYHDIEDFSKNKKPKDYLYHFLEDPRRSYTFARNRIVFHKKYSSNLQNVFIFCFWIWLFSAYYIYKYLFYKGFGDFSFQYRIFVSFEYLKGNISGYRKVFKL